MGGNAGKVSEFCQSGKVGTVDALSISSERLSIEIKFASLKTFFHSFEILKTIKGIVTISLL